MSFKKILLHKIYILFLILTFFVLSRGVNFLQSKIYSEPVLAEKNDHYTLRQEIVELEEEYFDEETEELTIESVETNTALELTVVRIVDGDTVELSNGEVVRYIGIDTPEISHSSKKTNDCFAEESKFKNQDLVLGQNVRLEKDITDRDRYGRLLRYVYVGDVFVNYNLVLEGFAQVYTYPPDIKHNELFLQAQRQAREESRGLWNKCQ